MRPLRISLVLVAAATQWACVDEARTETASAHARDSALVHDLVLAGYDSAAIKPAGRYFGAPATGATVTESSGELADAASRADASSSSASSPSAPSPSRSSPAAPESA